MRIHARAAIVAISSLLIAGLAPLSAVAATPDREAPAAVEISAVGATTYHRTAYDGVIYSWDGSRLVALTYGQWQSAGAPTPAPVEVDYYKYVWAATIFARASLPDGARPVTTLTGAHWNRAGNPAPRTEWVQGVEYYQWTGSKQIIASVSALYGKYTVTAAQWKASGYQPFTTRANQGFVRLSWNSTVAFLTDYANGKGAPISGAQWKAEGSPAPTVKSRFPGDQVWQRYGETAIRYSGPTVSKILNSTEWRAMGFPRPEVRGAPAPQPAPAPAPVPRQYQGAVTPGAFCAQQYAGWVGYTSAGTKMVCTTSATDSRLRWRAA